MTQSTKDLALNGQVEAQKEWLDSEVQEFLAEVPGTLEWYIEYFDVLHTILRFSFLENCAYPLMVCKTPTWDECLARYPYYHGKCLGKKCALYNESELLRAFKALNYHSY